MEKYTDEIISTIYKHLPANPNDWILSGFINLDKKIYTFGNDSKIIGRLFEVIVADALQAAAKELGFELAESEKQTVYPDFYFIKPNKKRIAIDVKTTYRRSKSAKYGFTGGSFTSFMRNGTKNISGHYSDYDAHYILGIVYTREDSPTTGTIDLKELDLIIPAYKDIEFFVQEKFRICGESKGSGNTDNIGTIKANNIKPFVEGTGPFSFLGIEAFHDYWRHYPKYKDSDETKAKLYTNITGYINWVKVSDPERARELQEKYDEYLAFIKSKSLE